MTNILKKSVFTILCCLAATTLFAQKTYTFDDGVDVETDWTITKDVPDGGNGACALASSGKFSAKDGNYLLFSFENKSKITITITSTASFENISNITFDAIANDNSKPDFTLNIVDDGGNVVKNVYSNAGTKADFNTGGTNKWGVSNSDISPAVSGHVQLVLYASSSGKYAAIDNLKVTSSGGGTTPEPQPEDGEPIVTKCTFDNIEGTAQITEIDKTSGTITAKIKYGADRSNITPKFEGKNLDSGWAPLSADFSTQSTQTFIFTYSNSGNVKNYDLTITEAEEEKPDTPTPSGDIYAHWRFSGGDPPADNTFEDGTNIRVEFLTDGSKSFTNESAAYNTAVPDDMKSQGSNGLKSGGNVLFLKVTTLNGQGFKKDDIVTLCGYNPWKISSTADHTGDISASLATGTGKGDYNIGYVTLAADAEALYMKRAEGTGTGICAIKVTRGGSTTPEPQPGDDPVAVTSVSLDKTELSLTAGQKTQLTATIQPSNATDKTLSWSSDNESVATVSNGYVSAVAEGTATITVTTKDGSFTTTCTVTVTKKDEPEKPDVPSTDLTLHVPEVYEAKEIAGGYNTPLAVSNGREYEVYYINRDSEGKKLAISTSNTDKAGNICDVEASTEAKTVTKDGWAKISDSNKTGGDSNAEAKDEFQSSLRSVKFNNEKHELVMYIQGYDQFSFYGKDNNATESKGKHFEVYIDDVKQSHTPSDYAIHRFDISSGRHVIRLTAIGGSDSKLCSFSLRLAQEPRAKRISGNDTTQVIYQTQAPRPVYYFTKYASMGETRLEWNRSAATGITLEKIASSDLGDTLMLAGTANCPVGEYGFAVVTYYNNKETSRVPGRITVVSDIKSTSDINVTCYQGEEMDQITFRYYALSADDVTFKWTNGTPAGITDKGSDGKYVISGTPSATGDFPYEISVLGADTVIKGNVTVRPLDLGSNPVLYLYKNNINDGVYTYLQSKNWNLVDRKTLENGLRPAEQYAKYKWILISEDADANNPEVLQLIRGGANIPVLNMNGFTYADGRLGWGEPNNGTVDTLTNNGCNIFVERSDHPIFNGFSGKNTIKIFSKIDTRGVMPIKVTLRGTHCLATAYTRNIEEYYEDGEKQTIIHEVPAAMRGGQKYICFPISKNSTANLTDDGKKLLDAIISYLTNSSASPIELPELQINRFVLEGHEGTIDQADNTIEVKFSEADFVALDSLRSAKPVITLADQQYSHLIPGVGNDDQAIDFRFSSVLPVTFTVTDYINIRTYSVSVRSYRPEGLENVYTAGEWVNIFDLYGRKVATTNEDIYTMPLPQGMYIVVTASGSTLKIMR